MQRASRLTFARKIVHCTNLDWYKIIWTNESSFELKNDSCQIWIWHKVHKKYATNCLVPIFKSRQTSSMILGAFIRFDKSPLVIMAQNKEIAIHFVEKVYEGTLSKFYFMHDKPYEPTLMEDGTHVH